MNLAYLGRVDPIRNMLRFYAIRIAPTLFGEWAVVRQMGADRLGSGAAKLVRQRGEGYCGRAAGAVIKSTERSWRSRLRPVILL